MKNVFSVSYFESRPTVLPALLIQGMAMEVSGPAGSSFLGKHWLAQFGSQRGGLYHSPEMRSVLYKLTPFLISCALYFLLGVQEPSIFASILRSLPTISLAFFVANQSNSTGTWTQYSQKILEGLMFAAVGDVLIVWPKLLLPAMIAFAACFISYTSAFGFTPFRPLILTILAIVGIEIYNVLLLPCLGGIFLLVVPVYLGILGIMVWRALSLPKRQLSATVGSVIFSVSELFDGLDIFCSKVPNFRFLVMATYYTAQGLIAFSVTSQEVP
nr:PREDICTED: lysoplasmalogenase-like isoform X2 [Anolis carolinensis]|eukprot:XP_016852202.1 PREDICTED: lysoplasmalogenase-like isoform X2 [Anolis carolinensis]